MMKMNGKIVITISAFTALILLFFIACSATDLPVIQPRLENASVDPDNGTWDQKFDYTVNCTFSKEVNITLEVYNLSLLDWKPVERGTYNKKGVQQPLTWENVKICSDECAGTSRYRFKYNGSVVEEPYFGPKIPLPTVKEEFKNATANPPSGNWSDYFNYSVYVNTNKTVNIRLEVFDVCSGEWKTKGNRFYDDPGKWQKRTWEKVKPFSANCTGVASYQFIDEISKHESEIYYGPVLINVSGLQGPLGPEGPQGPPGRGGGGGGGGGLRHPEWLEPGVLSTLADVLAPYLKPYVERPTPEYITPTVVFSLTTTENITRSTPLTISVKLKNPNSPKNRSIVTLKLKIKHPGEDEQELYDERIIFPNEYKGPNNDTWEENFTDTFFSKDKQVGNASFLLEWDDKHRKYPEKWINITIINSPPNITNMSVSPQIGTYRQKFAYTANVSDRDEDEVEVTLHILIPSSGEWMNDTKIIKGTKNGTNVTWSLSPFSRGDEKATSEYYFIYNDGIYENNTLKIYEMAKEKAPYIRPISPLKIIEQSLNPAIGNWNDNFTYKATVSNPSEYNATVTLWVYIPSGNWSRCDDKQIEAGEEGKNLNWQISPFGVKDFNKISKYKFTHLGEPIKYKGKEEFDGPKIEDVLIPVL